jgi:hypothetical protein
MFYIASKVKTSKTVNSAISIINNADEIHSQLKKLSHEFYHCIDFDSMFSMSLINKEKLKDFIHPSMNINIFNKMFEDFEIKSHENNRQRKLYGIIKQFY